MTTQDAKGNPAPPLGSRGSGFIIDPHGYILTAQHVIDKAKEIEIRLADSQRLPAQVIATDSQIDVAILKIKPSESCRLWRSAIPMRFTLAIWPSSSVIPLVAKAR